MIFLGDLPNPVHGMSSVNNAVLDEAKSAGIELRVINTVPSYAAGFFGGKLWPVFKFFHSILCFFKLFFYLIRFNNIVYRPINGGSGQLYDLIYLFVIKLFRSEVIIHHHSFNYLNNYSALYSRLNEMAGSALHVVLGDSMGERLIELYGVHKSQIHVLSNVSFFDKGNQSISTYGPDDSLVSVGHLANLCIEKGVGDFIDLCRSLVNMKVPFEAYIAGPFTDSVSKTLVLSACEEIAQINYLGPLYGEKKDSFFKSLDVFVFPSQYCNEAEPLVLYEAGEFGVLNVGTKRGCMSSVINSLGGYAIDETDTLVSDMASVVKKLYEEGGLSQRSKEIRIDLFLQAKREGQLSLQHLLRMMKAESCIRN